MAHWPGAGGDSDGARGLPLVGHWTASLSVPQYVIKVHQSPGNFVVFQYKLDISSRTREN